MKKLSERIAMLEEMGVDTTKFNLELTNQGIEVSSEADEIVEDKQVNNEKLFRRWVMAQTFKMLYTPSYNLDTKLYEEGWDAYLRNNYSYMYQFSMLADEIKTLAKLEIVDKDEFEERSQFFTQDVVVETCKDYVRKFNKYVSKNQYEKYNDIYVKLSKYGVVDLKELKSIREDYAKLIESMEEAETYAELNVFFKKFMAKMNKLPKETVMSRVWRDAYKGNGAYYTLKNMIMFHGCVIRECDNKNQSLQYLINYCKSLKSGNQWRLHELLKDTIQYNDFKFGNK